MMALVPIALLTIAAASDRGFDSLTTAFVRAWTLRRPEIVVEALEVLTPEEQDVVLWRIAGWVTKAMSLEDLENRVEFFRAIGLGQVWYLLYLRPAFERVASTVMEAQIPSLEEYRIPDTIVRKINDKYIGPIVYEEGDEVPPAPLILPVFGGKIPIVATWTKAWQAEVVFPLISEVQRAKNSLTLWKIHDRVATIGAEVVKGAGSNSNPDPATASRILSWDESEILIKYGMTIERIPRIPLLPPVPR